MDSKSSAETTIVTVDPHVEKLILQWTELKHDAILQSVDGRSLGRIVPASSQDGEMPWEPDFTESEFIDRARRLPRHKLKEVLTRLDSK